MNYTLYNLENTYESIFDARYLHIPLHIHCNNSRIFYANTNGQLLQYSNQIKTGSTYTGHIYTALKFDILSEESINQPKHVVPCISENNTALKVVIDSISPTTSFTSAHIK